MTANEENVTASFPVICPITLSTIPAAINPMAPKTTALYDAEAVAQNSLSTTPFYGQDESALFTCLPRTVNQHSVKRAA